MHTTNVTKQLSSHESHKSLEHWTKPHTDNKARVGKLKEKSDHEAKKIEARQMRTDDAWTCCFAVHLPKIMFPMHVCYHLREECKKIQKRAMRILLARCGHNRRASRKMVFGPASLRGCSFQHLCYEQGINQVQWFLQQWRTPGQLQDLLHVAVSWCQTSIGFGVSFLTDVNTPAPHFESALLKAMREFLKHIDGGLELEHDHVPLTQRIND